jgi:hypothetical protein
MSQEKIIKIKADIKDAEAALKKLKKDTGELETSVLDATDSFGAFGVTVGGLKGMFAGAMKSAKMMFSSVKIGLISTGIGAFVVALGTMAQYFKDNEEGASKFREITSQLGVVIGNITDVISDFGGALIKLFSKDFKGFKDSMKDAVDGVKNFGKTTKEEMEMAKKLEKERAELIIFERDANVSKAKSEAEIMKLRMQARDEEKFTNEERLEFMRQANKLADEQLKKDLHIAQKKLEFQRIENSYSKSSTENLNAEADLEAQLFNIQRSNFSERKRMKSEEQAIVKRISADNEKEAKAEENRLAKEQENKEKELELLRTSGLSKQELEIEQATTKYEALLALAEKYGHDTTAITTQFENQKLDIINKFNKEEEKQEKKKGKDDLKIQQATLKAKQAATINSSKAILSGISQLAGEGTKVGKAAAVAQILIDTASGISSAIAGASAAGAASGPAAPITTPLLIAQLVGQVLAGIGQAKAVLGKVKDGGGGGELSGIDSVAPSTGGTVSVTDAEPEEDSPTGLGPLVPNIEAITTATQPIQAFVVENDISSSQALQEELELQATL